MKIWKDKEGNKLTFKEFMKRWGKGIEGITPLQKLKTQVTGTKIMLVGLIAGLVVSIIGWKKLWWVGIILIGALFNTGVQYLGLVQQKKLLEGIEKQFKEGEEMEDFKEAVSEAEEVKPIILDDNALSISLYAEEHPKNFEKISNSLEESKGGNK